MIPSTSGLLGPQPEGIPVPHPSGSGEPYWGSAAGGKLVFQRCDRCGAIPRRPSSVCGACGARELQWEPSSGRGTLYSWTVVWRPQHPSFRTPYAPAIMAVEEGWWLVTSVIGVRPNGLVAGMPLQVVFHPAGSGIWLPYAEAVTQA